MRRSRVSSVLFAWVLAYCLLAIGAVAHAECNTPACPTLAGDPAAAYCAADVCNPHVFIIDNLGRLLDFERMLIDTGWPCPGRCPLWDESSQSIAREIQDMGWQVEQVSSSIECDPLEGAPAYYSDPLFRRVAAKTTSGKLMAWSSSAECCRHCAQTSSNCDCTITPSSDLCSPPECTCTCTATDTCSPWPTDLDSLTPTCNCQESGLTNSPCCWNTEELTALADTTIKGNPAMTGDGSGAVSVYARGKDDHLFKWDYDGTSWSFSDLTEQAFGGEVKIKDDPSVFMVGSVPLVVAKGGSDHLLGIWQMNGWHWVDLSDMAGSSKVEGRPVVYYNSVDSTGYIFARGREGELLQWTWNGVDGMQFAKMAQHCGGSVAGNISLCFARGSLNLFYRDTNNHLIHLYKNCSSDSSWRCGDLTEAGCGRTIAGDPSCLIGCDATAVYARSPQGHLLRWTLKTDGFWQVTDISMDTGCPNDIGMTFAFMPAGSFSMGSPAGEFGRDTDEGPVHSVTLTSPFYMGTTEVTQAQWEAVMGSNPSVFGGCPTCPVENVSWHDVLTFVEKMNQRCEGTYSLPTEAEWEYAARAGTTTTWFFGENMFALGNYAWYSENAGGTTHPVASKAPNPWGLFDIYGNVWEWVSDAYTGYSSTAQTDPFAMDSTWTHPIRGGSWDTLPEYCRSASRHYELTSDQGRNNLGIRLKRTSPDK